MWLPFVRSFCFCFCLCLLFLVDFICILLSLVCPFLLLHLHGDHVLWCPLLTNTVLSCSLSSVCFPLFFSPNGNLIRFGSVHLVTTAGFVAGQVISVQYNGGLLPDIILSTRCSYIGEPF